MTARKNLLIAISLFFITSAIYSTSPTAPTNLRCFDKNNPVGVGDKPYFGWFVNDKDNNEIQSAYQIIISSSLTQLNNNQGDCWDSGKTNSRNQNYIYVPENKLSPATQYYWKVRTWDKDGNVSPYSEPATFATGLFANADWEGAKWIKRNTNDADDYTYFRRKFKLQNKEIKRAVIYIAACHSYEFFINGKFIGKGFNNHYPQYSYYNAWDITSALKSNASNSIACLTHWYGGGQGRATGSRGLLMKTIIEYTDNTKSIIGTDKNWKQIQAKQWITGQPQRNGEGIGRIEKFDSRKTIRNWQKTNFNDKCWKYATEIGPHPTAPWTAVLRPDLTRVIEKEMKPVSVKKLENNKYIIDLGKIYSGSFKIKFEGGNNGDSIRLLGGFVLNEDGTVSTKLDQQTNMNFYFIHNGKKSEFYPYVYLGMRYLQVENSPNVLTTENVSFVFRRFELDESHSSFESSNSMLNNVWDLMIHSILVGSQEGFVDTPTREKGSFLGDGWSQAVPAMSTMYDRTMNLRVLNEFLDSQDQYWPDGRLNAVYPNVDGGRDIPDYTQSYLVWIWDYYMQTGNVEFLKTNYNKLKKVAKYVDTYTNKSTGLINKLKGGKGPYEFGIIDWPANMRYGYDMTVDSRTVVDAYAYADFDIISKIAEVTGNSNDQKIYRDKANRIKEAINSQLLTKEGVYIDGLYEDNSPSSHVSQHANIFPLALGIVPQKNIETVVAEIKKQKMSVGMVCLRWLPESLGKAGEGEHLIELYTNKKWDGWAKTIDLGGTVTWESWNANLTNESLSHPWGAVGLLAIQNYILGIEPLKAQHEVVQIKPLFFGNKLSFAKGTYPTDKGSIKVDWKNNDNYVLNLTIPVNITARVYIPKCGKPGTSIKINNKIINGNEEGDYLRFDNIGTGTYTFER